MYLIIAENLRKARQKDTTGSDKKVTSIQPNQLVTLKVHIRRTFRSEVRGYIPSYTIKRKSSRD